MSPAPIYIWLKQAKRLAFKEFYFIALLALGVFVTLARTLILHGKKNKSGFQPDILPVEAAYLESEGDANLALTVLVVDLIHKEVKVTRLSNDLTLIGPAESAYAASIKDLVKRAVVDWGKRQVDQVMDLSLEAELKKNPLKVIRRLPFLFNFLRKGLFETIKDVLKDPRQIRKYFSTAGILRLAAQISASGYKQSLSADLRVNLLNRGLLMNERERKKTAGRLLFAIIFAEVALLGLSLYFMPTIWQSLLIFFFALLSALTIKGSLAARDYIPIYADLFAVLKHTHNHNWRVRTLRVVINTINLVLSGIAYLIFFVMLGLGSLILVLTHTVTDFSTYLALLMQMLVQVSLVSLVFDAHRYFCRDCPTAEGEEALMLLKHSFVGTTTLDALKSMLTSPDYDARLSYMLAIYGLEALLFL